MIIVRCHICHLDYDEVAYRHHLAKPCDHGIRPMLACDKHDIDCKYNNPVWRHEVREERENNEKLWRQRPCKPIYAVVAGRIHYRSDQEMWPGTYLTLYVAERPKPRTALLPAK